MNELYHPNEILKIKDYIHLINFRFVKDVLSNESLGAFSNNFTKSDEFYDQMTHDTHQDTPSSWRIQIPSLMVLSPSGIRQLPYGIFCKTN